MFYLELRVVSPFGGKKRVNESMLGYKKSQLYCFVHAIYKIVYGGINSQERCEYAHDEDLQ